MFGLKGGRKHLIINEQQPMWLRNKWLVHSRLPCLHSTFCVGVSRLSGAKGNKERKPTNIKKGLGSILLLYFLAVLGLTGGGTS
jgi:hypothetical protein